MKCNFIAPINNLGYGVHARSLIQAWMARGHEASLVSIGDTDPQLWTEALIHANRSLRMQAPTVIIWHEQQLQKFDIERGNRSAKIGFPVFELETFDAAGLTGLKSCDQLLTPTTWGQQVLERHGFMSQVVPEGFDPNTFRYVPDRDVAPFPRYLMAGKWEQRKHTTATIRAWVRATEGIHAELRVHAYNPFIQGFGMYVLAELETATKGWNQNVHQGWLGFHEPGNRRTIYVSLGPLPVEEIPKLYQQADFGLFCSRAEGWDLPLVECAASGTPAVATPWSGHSEYVQPDLGWPDELIVKNWSVEPAHDGIFFDGTRGNWRVPWEEEIITAIRYCGSAWRDRRHWEDLSIGCRSAVRDLTWDASVKSLEVALCGI